MFVCLVCVLISQANYANNCTYAISVNHFQWAQHSSIIHTHIGAMADERWFLMLVFFPFAFHSVHICANAFVE